MNGRGAARRLRRGSRERSSLVITKGAKRLSNDHVVRRPVKPAAHSVTPNVRGTTARGHYRLYRDRSAPRVPDSEATASSRAVRAGGGAVNPPRTGRRSRPAAREQTSRAPRAFSCFRFSRSRNLILLSGLGVNCTPKLPYIGLRRGVADRNPYNWTRRTPAMHARVAEFGQRRRT
jgi:hypothetical protein